MPSDLRQIVVDLLSIAEVAMPGKLYEEDPRVIKARAWLEAAASDAGAIRDIEERVAEAAGHDKGGPKMVPGRVPSVRRS
jgi:hypothetical protein